MELSGFRLVSGYAVHELYRAGVRGRGRNLRTFSILKGYWYEAGRLVGEEPVLLKHGFGDFEEKDCLAEHTPALSRQYLFGEGTRVMERMVVLERVCGMPYSAVLREG